MTLSSLNHIAKVVCSFTRHNFILFTHLTSMHNHTFYLSFVYVIYVYARNLSIAKYCKCIQDIEA